MRLLITEKQLKTLLIHESKTIESWMIMEQVPDNNPLYNQIRSKSQSGLVGSTYGGQPNKLSQKQVTDIKGYVQSSQFDDLKKMGPVPFKTQEEGNKFRKWVNDNYKSTANFLKLDEPSSTNPNPPFNNDYIKRAWYYKIKDNQTLGAIYSKVIKLLDNELMEAKKWWISWISSEKTRAKFRKLNNVNLSELNTIFLGYYAIIAGVKLEYYNVDNNVYAHIGCDDLKTININLNLIFELDSSQIESIIVHEMQHILYCYRPLTPDKDVTQFKSSDQCYEKNKEIYNNQKINKFDRIETLLGTKKDQIAKDLGISSEMVIKNVQGILQDAYAGWSQDYLLRSVVSNKNSEFQSRLSGMRHHFGLSDGADIPVELVVNYIKNPKKEGNTDFILAHWAMKEFPPLADYVNDLNTKFVKTDGTNIKQKSPFDLPYKPGEGIV